MRNYKLVMATDLDDAIDEVSELARKGYICIGGIIPIPLVGDGTPDSELIRFIATMERLHADA